MRTVCLLTLGLTAAALSSGESVISLVNRGFEVQTPFTESAGCNPGPNCYNYSVVGWDVYGTGGTFDPSLSPAVPHALEGNNVAWLNGGYIAQSVGSLTSGLQYAVSVYVAGRDLQAANYRIGASFGNTTSTFTDYQQISGTTTNNSTWSIATLHFTPDQSGNWFVFVAQDSGFQLFVDGTPEPGSFLLLGTGIAALIAVRRRRSGSVI